MLKRNKTKNADSGENTPPAGPAADPGDNTPEQADASNGKVEAQAEETKAEVSETPPDGSAESEALAAIKDRYARLLADFDNYRKRLARDREELVKRANSDLLSDLLPVIDHLEMAITQAKQPDDPFVAGVKLVYDQFLNLLDKYEMRPLDAKGEPFDPSFHEALSQMSSDTVPANVVIEQFRRGWLLAGKLLRPSQVIVSSGAPEEQPAEQAQTLSDNL